MNDKDNQTDHGQTNNHSTNEHQEVDSNRRMFMKNTGMVIGGVAGGSLLGLLTNQFTTKETTPPMSDQAKSSPSEARIFFTRYEDFAVLEQATERIFPDDVNGPGAIELGVPYFIDKQLTDYWGMNGKDYRKGPFFGTKSTTEHSRLTRGELFINAVRKMNELSQKHFNISFDQADEEQQNEILQKFEDDKVDMKGVSSASFFELLRLTVLEGVYSDPLYGGNRNMGGWKMKEYPGPISAYIDKIESKDFIKMDSVSLTDYQQKS